MPRRFDVDISEDRLFDLSGNIGEVANLLSLNSMTVMQMGSDDFDGDAINGKYSTNAGAGATAAAIDTGKVNGQVKLDTGSTDNSESDICSGNLSFRGDQYPVFIACIAVDVITTCKVEVCFTDVLVGTDLGSVNVLATPSFNATDAVGWVFDTDDNQDWQNFGVDSGSAATKIEDGITPVAATFEYLGIELVNTDARFHRWDKDGQKTYTSTWMTGACTETVLLTPTVFVQNRSAAAHVLSLDWWNAWQRRTST